MSDSLADRLSRIQTQWTLLAHAHADKEVAAQAAQRLLLDRYLRSVFRYLMAITRNAESAEELTQEFSLRFLRGDFQRADASRGRFRDYLKTVLANLARSEWRRKANWPGELPEAVPGQPAPDASPDFANAWREELLDRTWQSLAKANPAYHAALRCRIDNPDFSSAELSARLSAEAGKDIPAATVRKTLQRSHRKFAELLVEEVAATLDPPSPDLLRAELEELKLLPFCRSVLDERELVSRVP